MRKPYVKGNLTLDEFRACINIGPVNVCWNWMFSPDSKGYGNLRRNKKLLRAHRVSFELHNNISLSSADLVLHKCDNRLCCNPNHLYVGTTKDNANDKVLRDRHNRGRRVWKASLHDTDIQTIFDLRAAGWSGHKIGDFFAINASSIYRILQRKAWKHVKLKTNNRAKCAKTKENLC